MKYCFLLFFLLFIITQQKLLVVEPQELRKQLRNEDIKYRLSPFGDIPFGKQIYGDLILPDKAEDFCEHVDRSLHREGEARPFVLIKSGRCAVSKKLFHAQKQGASLAIIYDQNIEDFTLLKPLTTTREHEFQIPSIVITNDVGLNLRSYLMRGEHIALSIKFKKHLQNHIDVVLDVRNLHKSATLMKELDRSLKINPEFYVEYYYYLDKLQSDRQYFVKCYSDKYCLEDKDQLDELLFQACLSRYDKDSIMLYYKYMLDNIKMYEENASLMIPGWENYSEGQKAHQIQIYAMTLQNEIMPFVLDKKRLKKYDYDKITYCVEASFEKGNRVHSDNYILEQSLSKINDHQILHYPSVLINDQYISLEHFHKKSKNKLSYMHYITYEMCQQSKKVTKGCKKYRHIFENDSGVKTIQDDEDFYDKKTGVSSVFIVFLILSILVGTTAVFVMWYKRRQRYYFQQDHDQAQQLIQKHMELKKNTKKQKIPQDEEDFEKQESKKETREKELSITDKINELMKDENL